MTSTLNWPRRIDPTIQPIENTRPSTVPAIHNTLAAAGADSNHATPPATNNTVDTANRARSLFSPNQVTISMPPIIFRCADRARHRGAATTLDVDADKRCRGDTAGHARPGAGGGPGPGHGTIRARSTSGPPNLIQAAIARQGRRSPPKALLRRR